MGGASQGGRVGSAERVEAVTNDGVPISDADQTVDLTEVVVCLRRAAQEACHVINKNQWILTRIHQDERVAFKDLAFYAGCTNMSWWDTERPEVR